MPIRCTDALSAAPARAGEAWYAGETSATEKRSSASPPLTIVRPYVSRAGELTVVGVTDALNATSPAAGCGASATTTPASAGARTVPGRRRRIADILLLRARR